LIWHNITPAWQQRTCQHVLIKAWVARGGGWGSSSGRGSSCNSCRKAAAANRGRQILHLHRQLRLKQLPLLEAML
jgi:hypothetical protein